ncbi:MAG TPA: hypothetical protein DCE44_20980 [Verrucomicrobiales bacterium]|nr:hypothetical protein [Verrucomicrobiales bacterium]
MDVQTVYIRKQKKQGGPSGIPKPGSKDRTRRREAAKAKAGSLVGRSPDKAPNGEPSPAVNSVLFLRGFVPSREYSSISGCVDPCQPRSRPHT